MPKWHRFEFWRSDWPPNNRNFYMSDWCQILIERIFLIQNQRRLYRPYLPSSKTWSPRLVILPRVQARPLPGGSPSSWCSRCVEFVPSVAFLLPGWPTAIRHKNTLAYHWEAECIPSRVDTPMGTQAPMGTHLYIYDYQIKSTAFLTFRVNYIVVQASSYTSYL